MLTVWGHSRTLRVGCVFSAELQGRLTLLLGPPGSGKSTLLKALAGKLQGKSPRLQGAITYNGETFDQFVPQRTAAYVSQVPHFFLLLLVLVCCVKEVNAGPHWLKEEQRTKSSAH